MNRNASILVLVVLALAAGSGCSSKPSASESKKGASALDRIQGRSQVLIESQGAMGNALNAGSESSVYIWVGLRRYRLFFTTPIDVTHGKDYMVEGVYAQGVIDGIGDPDEGKNGYPLLSSCRRVITKAWNNLPLDAYDLNAQVLRTRISRFPARPVFLVTRIEQVQPKEGDASAAAKKDETEKDKNVREVSVPAEKQSAFLIASPPIAAAPLWEPLAESIKCSVVIGTDGKIDRLETGKQLCESVDWSQYRYQPPVVAGKPVKVSTDVEVRFQPRKQPTS